MFIHSLEVLVEEAIHGRLISSKPPYNNWSRSLNIPKTFLIKTPAFVLLIGTKSIFLVHENEFLKYSQLCVLVSQLLVLFGNSLLLMMAF